MMTEIEDWELVDLLQIEKALYELGHKNSLDENGKEWRNKLLDQQNIIIFEILRRHHDFRLSYISPAMNRLREQVVKDAKDRRLTHSS